MENESDWDRASALFSAALALPPDQRDRLLAAACAENAALRAEVESLLRAHDAEPGFLEQSVAALELPGPAATAAGQIVGAYRLSHRIGQGGMAEVYFAQRTDVASAQGVAIKLLHAGYSHPEHEQRFRREQRILARLEHPSICRLLDCGTAPDGRLYLATEFVEGAEPIDHYCDRHRLDIKARIGLFRQLCDAVHHSHQRLIIHGDLKPGNVLVSSDGRIKLLDFGISRLLGADADDVTQITGALPRPMTPAYASPEQVRGESPTTASDVYSLGVLLYELLGGERPYSTTTRNPAELVEIVSFAMPEPPSRKVAAETASARGLTRERLVKALRGDLDRITLQALAKSPKGRYPSAAALADDLGRYVDGFPVQARPIGSGERLAKFIRRNPLSSGAVAMALLATLVFVGSLLYFNVQIRRQADALQLALGRAEATSQFLTGLFETTGPMNRVDLDSTAGDLLEAGKERLLLDTKLADGDRASLLTTMAMVYESLGQYPLAGSLVDKARALYAGDQEVSEGSLGALTIASFVQYRLGNFDEAEKLAGEALVQALAVIPDKRAKHASIRNVQGLSLLSMGRIEESEAVLAAALRDRRALAATDTTAELGMALSSYGTALEGLARYDEAQAAFEESAAIFRRDIGPDSPRLAMVLLDQALLHNRFERWTQAEPLLRQASDILVRGLGPDHPANGATLSALAIVLMRTNRNDEALQTQQEGLRIIEKTMPENDGYISLSRGTLGRILLRLGRPADALPHLERAVATMLASKTKLPGLLGILGTQIEVLVALDQRPRAQRVLDQARALAAETLPDDHADRQKLQALSGELGLI